MSLVDSRRFGLTLLPRPGEVTSTDVLASAARLTVTGLPAPRPGSLCEHVFVAGCRRRGDDPPRRPRLLLRRRRAARRPVARGRPVIVGGGVVLAASYEARAFGIHSAMGGGEARRRCPHAVVVPPALRRLLRGEQGGVRGLRGHHAARRADLDRRGVPRRRRPAPGQRAPPEIAARLRAEVRDRVGLPITVGVARTKFLAKVASRRPSPTGCSSCRPTARPTSSTRCRSSGCGASAPDRREAAPARHHPVADLARVGEAR